MCVRLEFGDPVNNIHFLFSSSEPVEERLGRSHAHDTVLLMNPEQQYIDAATMASLHLVPKLDILRELLPALGRPGLPCSTDGMRA